MIRGNKDITDKEFKEIILPFSNNFDEYIINYVIPDVAAFYLANAHSRKCLTDSPLYNHINSAIDLFNVDCNINEIIPQVEKMLKVKYNLIIVKTNPLRMKKYM